MKLLKAIGKQLQHPRGLFGKILFAWMTRMTITHARWTADLLDVQPNDDILEIGFGNGANIKLLLQRASGGTVTGVEISETALEMASGKNAKAISEGKVILHLAPGNTLPSTDGVFDKACTVATAYVIEDPGAVFKEMYRVLKPNGRAAVTFPIRENFMRFKPVGTEGFYLHKLADLETAFRDAGFINCRTERNDRVKFGAHCMLGEKPDIN
ncbi:class I SAM-dependent methyltransferase [Sinomicrobium weinanense]|uniref:Methyltransferase domain-containing protein n=1 Tax=Sinomicrobium weinanense TaxID=2842200 RepID=A0A926JQ01_9FLAO|nr:class I SAM-dependent methyltransferase [Sinomicrobium weinanense]MBC9795259.1 methyltransferase domain-containing protein [Sinomicrobium weinanense]MBU3125731.1 class I SAM-dependent methyltransferase [Sinomicrobium weinanense]